MIQYQSNLYQEILRCYEYETRNASVYGNAIYCEVEFTQGSKECQLDRQGDENHIQ